MDLSNPFLFDGCNEFWEVPKENRIKVLSETHLRCQEMCADVQGVSGWCSQSCVSVLVSLRRDLDSMISWTSCWVPSNLSYFMILWVEWKNILPSKYPRTNKAAFQQKPVKQCPCASKKIFFLKKICFLTLRIDLDPNRNAEICISLCCGTDQPPLGSVSCSFHAFLCECAMCYWLMLPPCTCWCTWAEHRAGMLVSAVKEGL